MSKSGRSDTKLDPSGWKERNDPLLTMQMWDGVLVPHPKMNKWFCSFTLAFHTLWFKEKDGVFLELDLHFGPYGPATELAISRQIHSTKQTAHFLFVSRRMLVEEI